MSPTKRYLEFFQKQQFIKDPQVKAFPEMPKNFVLHDTRTGGFIEYADREVAARKAQTKWYIQVIGRYTGADVTVDFV